MEAHLLLAGAVDRHARSLDRRLFMNVDFLPVEVIGPRGKIDNVAFVKLPVFGIPARLKIVDFLSSVRCFEVAKLAIDALARNFQPGVWIGCRWHARLKLASNAPLQALGQPLR